MKTNLLKSLLLLVGAASAAGAVAETPREVAPLLTEGKSWLLCTHWVSYDNDPNRSEYDTYSRIAVDGDTIVCGKSCKRLKYFSDENESVSYSAAYEQDGRVYRIFDIAADKEPEFLPILDFNVKEDDIVEFQHYDTETGTLTTHSNISVSTVGTITVNNRDFRALTLGRGMVWVEGVGSASDSFWITDLLIPTPTEGEWATKTEMMECYENGTCIFTKADFDKANAGINPTIADGAPADGAVYDLLGRRVLRPAKGRIYLQSGRKHLAR